MNVLKKIGVVLLSIALISSISVFVFSFSARFALVKELKTVVIEESKEDLVEDLDVTKQEVDEFFANEDVSNLIDKYIDAFIYGMADSNNLTREDIRKDIIEVIDNNKEFFKEKLKVTDEDMQYFLFKAVEGIKIAIEEGHFRINESEQVLLNKFKRRQSALSEWLYENNMETRDIVGQRPMALYSQFKAWCEENGYGKVPATYSFKEDICALYDVEIDMQIDESGKPKKQVFIKRGEYNENFKPF